jgi:uncharacterized protein with PIN domain
LPFTQGGKKKVEEHIWKEHLSTPKCKECFIATSYLKTFGTSRAVVCKSCLEKLSQRKKKELKIVEETLLKELKLFECPDCKKDYYVITSLDKIFFKCKKTNNYHSALTEKFLDFS